MRRIGSGRRISGELIAGVEDKVWKKGYGLPKGSSDFKLFWKRWMFLEMNNIWQVKQGQVKSTLVIKELINGELSW